MRNIFTEHIECASKLPSNRSVANEMNKKRKKNKQTNKQTKSKRHINYVCNLCHTPGSKKHTNSSRSHAISISFISIHISHKPNCKLWKCCHNTTMMNVWQTLRCAVRCCDSFILAKYPGMLNTRSTNAIEMRLWWCLFFALSPSACVRLFIQNIKFIIIFTVCENCENIN